MRVRDLDDRIVSLDQFRGYAVVAMFIFNFLGGMLAIDASLQHSNRYFTYATSILPSFVFAAGFSYRLTFLRRLRELGAAAAYHHAVGRCVALIVISVMFGNFNESFRSWNQMSQDGIHEFVARLLKAELWKALAIIGMAQLIITPVVTAPARVRILVMAIFLIIHWGLSWSFNYDFVFGRPNWMDQYWGAAGAKAWDGGFFGIIMWAVPMLAGTLAYDIVMDGGSKAVGRLLRPGCYLMLLGYLLSCLSTLYDVPSQRGSVSASPVLPPLERLQLHPLSELIASPPFVEPSPTSPPRMRNYWMMDKRIMSIPFTLFGTGFALTLYGLFVLACDGWGWRIDLLRLLGQNALAAYAIHYGVGKTMRKIVPLDSPLWWCLTGLALFLAVTILFVRYLERHKVHLRL